jgi:hypothetical protein
MLDALTFKVIPNGVEVGIFDSDQAKKAHGHCTGFDGERPDLRRAFIPSPDESFNRAIMTGVTNIINRNSVRIPSRAGVRASFEDQIMIEDFFVNDIISRLLNG